MSKKIKKILIANRGEIALRIIRACNELEIATCVIFSKPDKGAKHVSLADEAWLLEGDPGKVYLDIAQIVELAKRSECQAIHPGYGFLAENFEFAKAVSNNGLLFIGPSYDVIHKMGNKIESRRLLEKAGIPIVPGTVEPVSDINQIKTLCNNYGFPIVIKASAGGGGRGLRVVNNQEELAQALATAQREGSNYFGNAEVYLEKYLEHARHIEVQILADHHGNVIQLGERDCSSQRRHQKLLEETPAYLLDSELQKKILETACLISRTIGYTSAGTIEGLVSNNNYYFLEMNTRIQVEHPITEMVTGIDIVKEQILIAQGEKLSFSQSEVTPRGHAIECRINAEDPLKKFYPSPGTVHTYIEPSMPWVRVDSACYSGCEVQPFYDSLLAKLIVWGRTRQEAIVRTIQALKSFKIEGVSTTIPFHLALLADPAFTSGNIYTTYVEKEFYPHFKTSLPVKEKNIFPAISNNNNPDSPQVVYSPERIFSVEVNKKLFTVSISELVPKDNNKQLLKQSTVKTISNTALKPKEQVLQKSGKQEIRSSMHSLVKQVFVQEGQSVMQGQKLLLLESMKMESEIVSHCMGKITSLTVKAGDTVESEQVLLELIS